jgi:hypothetical protein
MQIVAQSALAKYDPRGECWPWLITARRREREKFIDCALEQKCRIANRNNAKLWHRPLSGRLQGRHTYGIDRNAEGRAIRFVFAVTQIHRDSQRLFRTRR